MQTSAKATLVHGNSYDVLYAATVKKSFRIS